jgi:predicted MFS family arabinose efflux permease
MTAHGAASAIFSLLVGRLVKVMGRLVTVLIAFISHVFIIATLLVWNPDPLERVIYFVITVLWGAADAIWIVQIICKF